MRIGERGAGSACSLNLKSAIRNPQSAFTLIEVLLVVIIALLASAVAVPSFIRSHRGAKLRTSARTVLMSHRYARAMAVLKQVPVAVLFDANRQEVEIVAVNAGIATSDRDAFLDGRKERTGVASVDRRAAEEQPPAEEEAPAPAVASELIRRLADGVSIVDFDSPRSGQTLKGIHWVNYFPNGMCDAYSVTLKDDLNKRVRITVDALSGKAKAEYE